MISGMHVIMPEIPEIIRLATLMPEILVCSTALILLVGGVFLGDKNASKIHALGLAALVSLFIIMGSSLSLLRSKQILFSQLFIADGFSYFTQLLLVLSSAFALLLSDDWLSQPKNQRIEFPVLILFSLLGMMLMVSSNDFLSLYVSLELSSLPLYVMAAIDRDALKPSEAGLKYFVLSSLASGLLLFGISLVYGFAGTTNFETLTHVLKGMPSATSGIVMGLILIIVAFAFKIAAAPFHMWAPDVYEGAPTPVTAYFAIAPKIAAIALFARVLIQPFGNLIQEWQQVVVIISIISMIVGALGALTQSNIKRLLAYSSIGHVGYALMGIAAGTTDGIAGLLIYFFLYIFMSAGAFACVLMMSRNGQAVENISDLAGLSHNRPAIAFSLAAFMFSMAGIPPMAGFFGKLYVFLAALHAGLTILAVIGVLTSVIACFYYLKIVKLMYFDEPALPFDTNQPAGIKWALLACILLTLLFFLYPTPLVEQARQAAGILFQ